MEYNDVLVKFCERKLHSERPEYFNAISSLYISAVGYYNLFRRENLSNISVLIYWCIFANGIAAFFFHWYALYILKLLDEFTMIIPVWLGISKILIDFQIKMTSSFNLTKFQHIPTRKNLKILNSKKIMV